MEQLLFWRFPPAIRQLSWLAIYQNIEQPSALGS